jgi:hypothetical protein
MGLYHTPRVGQHTGTRSPLPAPHVFRHDLAPPAHGVTLCRDGWQLHPSHNLTPGCEDFTIAGVLTQTHSLLRLPPPPPKQVAPQRDSCVAFCCTKQQHEAAARSSTPANTVSRQRNAPRSTAARATGAHRHLLLASADTHAHATGGAADAHAVCPQPAGRRWWQQAARGQGRCGSRAAAEQLWPRFPADVGRVCGARGRHGLHARLRRSTQQWRRGAGAGAGSSAGVYACACACERLRTLSASVGGCHPWRLWPQHTRTRHHTRTRRHTRTCHHMPTARRRTDTRPATAAAASSAAAGGDWGPAWRPGQGVCVCVGGGGGGGDAWPCGVARVCARGAEHACRHAPDRCWLRAAVRRAAHTARHAAVVCALARAHATRVRRRSARCAWRA